MKKFAVIAGTPVDTKAGYDLINHLPLDITLLPVSNTPKEQTHFQTSSIKDKVTFIEKQLNELKNQDIHHALVYCNSLSGSVDFDKLAKKFKMKLITPLHVYRNLASNYQRIGIIAANAQGAAGIERELIQTNPTINTFSVTNLELVDSIEKAIHPSQLVQAHGLESSLNYFKDNQVQAIIMGCTHFPYIVDHYQELTDIHCLNPDQHLIKLIQSL